MCSCGGQGLPWGYFLHMSYYMCKCAWWCVCVVCVEVRGQLRGVPSTFVCIPGISGEQSQKWQGPLPTEVSMALVLKHTFHRLRSSLILLG